MKKKAKAARLLQAKRISSSSGEMDIEALKALEPEDEQSQLQKETNPQPVNKPGEEDEEAKDDEI